MHNDIKIQDQDQQRPVAEQFESLSLPELHQEIQSQYLPSYTWFPEEGKVVKRFYDVTTSKTLAEPLELEAKG